VKKRELERHLMFTAADSPARPPSSTSGGQDAGSSWRTPCSAIASQIADRHAAAVSASNAPRMTTWPSRMKESTSTRPSSAAWQRQVIAITVSGRPKLLPYRPAN